MSCIYGYPQCSGRGRTRTAWDLIGQMMDFKEFHAACQAAVAKDRRERVDGSGRRADNTIRIQIGAPCEAFRFVLNRDNFVEMYSTPLFWCSGACQQANAGNRLDSVVMFN